MCRREQLQPLGARHHLEVALQPQVHLGAVDDGARFRVVGHLLQGHGRAQHGAGELLSRLRVLRIHPHLVVDGKPAVAPAEHAITHLPGECLCAHEELQHRAPKTLHKERLGNRRQRREPPAGQKRPVCGKYMHMRVEVRQIPEGLHEQDQAGAGAGCRLGVRIDEQARGDAAKLAEPRPAPADRIGRSSRGRVNTYCRCGTGARTFCSTQSPYRSTRFWWQLGQKYRVLHEYASR